MIDGHRREAGADVPLSDAFALRAVGYANQDRGLIDNLYTKKRARTLAWGRGAGDYGTVASVPTDGNIKAPMADGVRPARVLRVTF